MKTVLFVTTFFPPCVNVATARSIKFLKYLSDFDWQAIVVCPEDSSPLPEAAAEQLRQVDPATVRISRSLIDPFQFLTTASINIRPARYLGHALNNAIPPDGHLYWAIGSLMHLEKLVRENNPDIIYTTCNPYSLNLAGLWIKKRYKIPWVTDFRDLWTLNQQPRRILNGYHQFVSRKLERLYLRNCSGLIVTTKNSRRRMVVRYPFLSSKTCVINNGFDPEDLHTKADEPFSKHSFLYSGSIVANTSYNPMPILRILSELAKRGKINNDWEFHYAGSQGRALKAMAAKFEIAENICDHGYLGHKEYYRLIRRVGHVILTLPPEMDCRSWVPSRTYDYMGNQARVICLAHKDSEVFKLLRSYGNSVSLFYEEDDNRKIEKLASFMDANAHIKAPSRAFLNQFERKNLTRKLAAFLNKTIEKTRNGSEDSWISGKTV